MYDDSILPPVIQEWRRGQMNVDYLRVSVTDRCNLQCVYCNPSGCCHVMDGDEILTFEEICRIVRLCARCGIRRVRLTGGEPLVRDNIVDLVRRLAAVPGVEDVSITTNGVLLSGLAAGLRDAGLSRLNVSLDAVTRAGYARITGSDLLPQVMDGIHRAIDVGLAPVKVNTVVMKGFNLSEIPSLARMSLELPLLVRFIEYCPTSRESQPADLYVPNSEVRRMIEEEFGPLSQPVVAKGGGPAVYLKIGGSAGAIGFISGRSSVFCPQCNRLRLSSDGRIKPCLYSTRSYDVRSLLRDGTGDEAILNLIQKVLREKGRYTRVSSASESFCMQSIGG
jgi:cyclic pyranopterin phosphate synthase